MYADDCLIFLKDTSDIETLDKILNSFYHISGLEINRDKTYIMKLGSCSQNSDSLSELSLGKLVPTEGAWDILFS